LSTDNRRSIFSRVAHALRTFNASEISARSVIPTTLPGTGVAGLQMVRSANPQEYKPLGANVRARGFNEHPVVHACIRAVADIVASVPLVVLKERGNRESAVGDNHPLQKLLNQPTGKMTARQLRARFAVDFLGYGNSLFHLERAGATGTGRIIGIRSINPEALQSVWVDVDGDPARYDYSDWSGIIRNAPVEDVLHFRDLDMPRPYFPDVFGYPRGATAIQSIVADNEATNYVRQVVSNDGTPTFAVILSDEATSDDALSMQQRYTARTVERGKRGAPAFFGAVKDIKPLGFTLNDLEFPDLRRVSREDICAAFGVDPRMIGIGSASNDAGLSGVQYIEARARLVQHTIEPMLIVFEDEINNWLAPEFGDVYVAYDSNVLRDLVENDEATSTRIRAEFAASLRTFEESRRALKLSPVPEPVESLLITPATTLMPSALAITPALSAEEEVALDAAPMPSANADAMVPPSGEMQTTEATVLNGAQIASAKDIVLAVAAGQMPRDAGVAMLKVFFNLSADVAEALMGSAGTGAATTPNVVSTDGSVTPVASAPVAAPVVEEEDDEEEDDDEEEMEEESEVEGVGMRAEGKTNFPNDGDDKKVSLRNSQWSLFPVGEAEDLKENWPEIWSKGGNVKGNEQFAKLAPIAKRGGVPDGEAEENAIRLREAWVARHEGDFQLAGVVAQIKWLAVGSRGLDHMRAVIREAKDKTERNTSSSDVIQMTDAKRAKWERVQKTLDAEEMAYKSEAQTLFDFESVDVERIFTANQRADAKLNKVKGEIRSKYAKGGEYRTRWEKRYQRLIGPTYIKGAEDVGALGVSFTLQSKEVQRAIKTRANKLAGEVSKTSYRQISAAIMAGERAGLSFREIADLVQQTAFGRSNTDARAMAIARTESSGAMSQGSWDQAKDAGIFVAKEWLSFDDGNTRPTHLQARDEGIIPINNKFKSNNLEYPLDPSGDADEVINCRCTLVYYTQDEI
jgi:HK97 family phage portal protein